MNLADKLSDNLVETDSGCWEFVGGRTGSGYGVVSESKYVQHLAHRLSYSIMKGPIPKGMIVCHVCDNKICCNPEHLFIGTYQDNKNDEISKGRHVKGSRQGNSKLNETDVIKIKQLIAENTMTLNAISRMYNVTGEAIGLIKRGKNWRWLT